MKKIRTLRILFDDTLQSFELPAFRGAIIDKTGRSHQLFHNHEGEGFRYAYPLIQYKKLRGKAAMVCIGEGVDQIHHFFNRPDWSLQISGRTLPMHIHKLEMGDFTLQVWNQTFEYHIQNWIALNPEGYKTYQQLVGEQEKKDFLAKKLVGNVLSFAKGLDWHIDKEIQLELSSPIVSKTLKIKDVRMLGFTLNFKTNVSLPHGIGLGKSVSLGYGVVGKAFEKGEITSPMSE